MHLHIAKVNQSTPELGQGGGEESGGREVFDGPLIFHLPLNLRFEHPRSNYKD